MDNDDFDYAEAFWRHRDAESAAMPRAELEGAIEDFLKSHTTLALATAVNDFVRCTPLEYTYDQGVLWIMSEGGLKFRALRTNRNVCAAIFEPFGSGALQGMQVTGRIEFVDAWSGEYNSFLELKGINSDLIRGMERPMPLLKLVPTEIDFLNAGFKKQGYGPRQHLDNENA